MQADALGRSPKVLVQRGLTTQWWPLHWCPWLHREVHCPALNAPTVCQCAARAHVPQSL